MLLARSPARGALCSCGAEALSARPRARRRAQAAAQPLPHPRPPQGLERAPSASGPGPADGGAGGGVTWRRPGNGGPPGRTLRVTIPRFSPTPLLRQGAAERGLHPSGAVSRAAGLSWLIPLRPELETLPRGKDLGCFCPASGMWWHHQHPR